MPNGRPGDHPVSDARLHDLEAITPEIDHLIREIGERGGWQSHIASAYLLEQQQRFWELDGSGDEEGARELLRGLKSLLESELRRLGPDRR